ncbi:MAG: excinuclease subunit, partial [Chthonomonadales bacterium]|nr:excinuclease subunit [Chthonomonadales bacterium]
MAQARTQTSKKTTGRKATQSQEETAIPVEDVQEEERLQAILARAEKMGEMPDRNVIRIRGARQNNLKNVDIDIPRDRLVVITGLSGSGKSSLAFDTLYAEGQRRYVESLSAYARQFLGQHDKPDVDQIDGLSPAVSIDQKSTSRNPRSTVGTVTEIYDYLRLLYARIGIPHDPETGLPMVKQSIEEMVDKVLALPDGARYLVLSPIVRGRKGEYKKELEEILKEGFVRARIDGEMVDLSEQIPDLERYKQHTIEIVMDRLIQKPDMNRSRIADSLEQALKRAKGVALVSVQASGDIAAQEIVFSENYATTDGGFNYEEIEPRLFSFNSPYGACPDCHGLGTKTEFDPGLIAPNRNLSIAEGGIRYYVLKAGKKVLTDHRESQFKAVAKKLGFAITTPLKDLSEMQFNALMYGIKGNVTVEFRNRWGRT